MSVHGNNQVSSQQAIDTYLQDKALRVSGKGSMLTPKCRLIVVNYGQDDVRIKCANGIVDRMKAFFGLGGYSFDLDRIHDAAANKLKIQTSKTLDPGTIKNLGIKDPKKLEEASNLSLDKVLRDKKSKPEAKISKVSEKALKQEEFIPGDKIDEVMTSHFPGKTDKEKGLIVNEIIKETLKKYPEMQQMNGVDHRELDKYPAEIVNKTIESEKNKDKEVIKIEVNFNQLNNIVVKCFPGEDVRSLVANAQLGMKTDAEGKTKDTEELFKQLQAKKPDLKAADFNSIVKAVLEKGADAEAVTSEPVTSLEQLEKIVDVFHASMDPDDKKEFVKAMIQEGKKIEIPSNILFEELKKVTSEDRELTEKSFNATFRDTLPKVVAWETVAITEGTVKTPEQLKVVLEKTILVPEMRDRALKEYQTPISNRDLFEKIRQQVGTPSQEDFNKLANAFNQAVTADVAPGSINSPHELVAILGVFYPDQALPEGIPSPDAKPWKKMENSELFDALKKVAPNLTEATFNSAIKEASVDDLTSLLRAEKPVLPTAIQALVDTGREYWKKQDGEPKVHPGEIAAGRKDGWVQAQHGKTEPEIIADLGQKIREGDLFSPQTYSLAAIEETLKVTPKKEVKPPVANQIDFRMGRSVSDLHFLKDPEIPNQELAVVQFASQLNNKEALKVEEDTTVENCAKDKTQGPLGIVEASSAALLRWAAEKEGTLPHALKNCGIPDALLDKCYKNGYLQLGKLTEDEQKQFLGILKSNIDKLQILPQHVICERSGNSQLQVFAAAPDFESIYKQPGVGSVANEICELLVVAQYKAAAQIAVIRSRETGKTIPLELTLVGQGAFSNNPKVMGEAFKAVMEVVKNEDVKVIYEFFGDGDVAKLLSGAHAAGVLDSVPVKLLKMAATNTAEYRPGRPILSAAAKEAISETVTRLEAGEREKAIKAGAPQYSSAVNTKRAEYKESTKYRQAVYNETLKACESGYINSKGDLVKVKDTTALTETYKPIEKLSPPDHKHKTKFEVVTEDTVTVAVKLAAEGKKLGVLNMANDQKPGGHIADGALAQEEDIGFRGSLMPSLKTQKYPYGESNTICTRKVQIIRDKDYAFMDKPVEVDFVGSALYDFRKGRSGQQFLGEKDKDKDISKLKASEFEAMLKNAGKYEEYKAKTKEKLAQQLRTFAKEGHTDLVLGAHGCGGFGNPPEIIAQFYQELLQSDEFAGRFATVTFAILKLHDKDQKNIDAFNKMSDAMNLFHAKAA